MPKTPENLSGPLFPHGFEGDDEDLDMGTYLPQTDVERQLFRALDIRLAESDKQDPNIPDEWYEEEGFIFARRIEPGESFEEIEEAWQGRGLSLEPRPVETDQGMLTYLVVKGKK